MTILTNAVPQWVSILFLFTILIPIFVMGNMAKEGALASHFNPKKYYNLVVVFLLLFFTYASVMSFTGIFQEQSLPPKIFLFTTLPLLLFYNLVTRINKNWKTIVANITLPTLIRFHVIRFIGLFFFLTYYYGALPKYFAISAGIGDVLAAITALFVAHYAEKKKQKYKQLTFAWNIIGLLDILNVIVSAIVMTRLAINTGTKGVLEIANFPFCLIPAFAPATIIFFHLCIFKKLKTEQL
jgi:hypothetical protein